MASFGTERWTVRGYVVGARRLRCRRVQRATELGTGQMKSDVVESSRNLKSARRRTNREPPRLTEPPLKSIVEQQSPEQPSVKSLGQLAERIFEKGADSLKENNPKPLKINRDLLLYHVKYYRRKGVVATDPRLRVYWFNRAEEGYRNVMRMDPTDCRAYVGLGRLFEQRRRYNDARRVYEDGCAVAAGRNAFLWTSWGNLEVKENNLDRGREYFKAAIAADRSHEAAWHSWGMLEKSIGDYQAARDCWMKGIRFAKETPSPYLFQSLALLASDLELYDQARHWFREGTQTVRGARSYALWTAWALLEAKEGSRELMTQLFEKSLELNPRGRYAYLSWGRIEQKFGNVDKARELFIEGHRENRSDPALLQALGILESECRNVDQARYYFRKSVDIDPRHQHTWQAWGVMESREQNYDKARKLFQRGVWANPNSKDSAFIFQAWGLMEENLGNADVARMLYRYGIKVDPQSEAVWDAWIRLEEKEEKYERANELRNYSIQDRVQVVLPRDFSTLETNYNFVEEFFTKFSDWLSKRRSQPKK